jgi:diguanylate cyclase (GGDEF)-like protein/PAS domain S-box-containing protein
MLDPLLFLNALDSLRECVVVVDALAPDRPVIYVNRAFEQLTGYRAKEVIGHNCRFLQGEGTDPAAVAQIREAIEAGAGCDVRLMNYRKDGSAFHNELRISPVFDSGGTLTHFIGLQRDVTREVVAEKLAQSYSDELEALNSDLHQLALRDTLTDLHNRRYFDLRLEVMHRTAAASCRPLGVLMIDVDYFKSFNDHYGHPRGDDCLREVGRVIGGSIGEAGLAARCGGEEFAVVTIGDSVAETRRLANRLRQRVAGLRLPHGPSPISDHLTISVGGVSGRAGDQCPPERFVEAADQALYDAKAAGRNRVVTAEVAAAEAATGWASQSSTASAS